MKSPQLKKVLKAARKVVRESRKVYGYSGIKVDIAIDRLEQELKKLK